MECWNMIEEFSKHQNKFYYQVDTKSGVFIKTGTLNSVYSSAYQCLENNKCKQ